MLALKRKHKDLNDDELMEVYQKEMFEQEKAKKAAKAELLHGLQKKKTVFRSHRRRQIEESTGKSSSPTSL